MQRVDGLAVWTVKTLRPSDGSKLSAQNSMIQ